MLAIIGAGQGRTGTSSLKRALDQLGFGPCHHMTELIQHPEQTALWERVFDDEEVDFEEVYAGYNSAVDAPTCFIYRELAERYPAAKLILTLRDPESWWRSASATVMSPDMRAAQGQSGHPMGRLREKITGFLARRGRPPRTGDHESAIAEFNRHNEEVLRTIPRERLLVYEVTQGWAPLCEFLKVRVPDAPFPHANTTEEFRARMKQRLSQTQKQ